MPITKQKYKESEEITLCIAMKQNPMDPAYGHSFPVKQPIEFRCKLVVY